MSIKNIFDEANEEYTDTFIAKLTKEEYQKRIEGKQKYIKGQNSKYEKEGYVLVEDLPKGKEFYIDEDSCYSYENGCEGGCFTILTTYHNKYYSFSFEWSN